MRVLGLAPHKMKAPLICIGEDKHGARLELRVDLKQNKEHWNLPYSSYFFNCALKGNFQPVQVLSFTLTITARLQFWRPGARSTGRWRG